MWCNAHNYLLNRLIWMFDHLAQKLMINEKETIP